jgi:hypothetical protein
MFAVLVASDIVVHAKAKDFSFFKVCGLVSFGLAILLEGLAYPYGKRNDELSGVEIESSRRFAAVANERAGNAMERAEKLEKENLLLRKELSPRRVTQQQRERLKVLLGKYKGIEIVSSRGVNGIGEAPQFREQLFRALEYAGLKARGGSNLPYSEMTGIHLEAFGDLLGRFADDLRAALIKVGIAPPGSVYVTKRPSLGNGQDRIDVVVLEKP